MTFGRLLVPNLIISGFSLFDPSVSSLQRPEPLMMPKVWTEFALFFFFLIGKQYKDTAGPAPKPTERRGGKKNLPKHTIPVPR